MKASALLATILFGAVSIASATPLCAIGGTMDSYVTLGSGGCTVGDLLFSNFVYNDSGSAPGSAVFLTPISSSLTNSGPGLSFTSDAWTATGNGIFLDSSIFFDVGTVDGRPLISGATLALVSSGATGDSGATIGENVVPGGSLEVDAGGPYVSGIVFAPVNLIHIEKDLSVASLSDGSSAFIGTFDEGFSTVPEPVGTVLIGSGLLALGIWRRRVGRG
jgi:hypothetical protein